MVDKKDPKIRKLMASTVIQTFNLIISIVKKDYGGHVTIGDLIELRKEMKDRYKKRGLID